MLDPQVKAVLKRIRPDVYRLHVGGGGALNRVNPHGGKAGAGGLPCSSSESSISPFMHRKAANFMETPQSEAPRAMFRHGATTVPLSPT